jgi:hypothetical protein
MRKKESVKRRAHIAFQLLQSIFSFANRRFERIDKDALTSAGHKLVPVRIVKLKLGRIPMDHQRIISNIDAEIANLQRARTLLSNAADSGSSRGIRTANPRKTAKRVRRKLSPEGRKRIADAQRKRWATAKKQKKSAATRAIRPKAAKKSGRPAKTAKNATPVNKPEATATA